MTAVDPRLGEIENRLNAATPGPWVLETDTDFDEFHGKSYGPWPQSLRLPVHTVGREDQPCDPEDNFDYYRHTASEISELTMETAEFIAHSPSDVAYLLAELRKRDEALERVERLAIGWHLRGESDMAFSKTLPDEDIAMAILTDGAAKVENARHIRNALKGDGA